ncbi:hypothetical protein ACTUV3_19305 (plasmid) [Acinetobacter baumannii]|uniref:hypothetical protein n=1 Tax=Acinetobacter baumannii TaxID=470 RepID=UPI003FA49B35
MPVSGDKPAGLLQAQSGRRRAPCTRIAGGALRASGSTATTSGGHSQAALSAAGSG